MLDGLKVVWLALNRVRIQGYQYIWANVAFIVLSIPIVTLPAAWRALIVVGHASLDRPHESDLGLFWDTFKESLRLTWKWGLANMVFLLIHFTNWETFARIEFHPISMILNIIWWGIFFVWLGVTLYTWTIYEEMAHPTVLGAISNSLIMVLQNPFFTLTILFVIGILILVSNILLVSWVLLTLGTISAIINEAVANRLSKYRIQVINGYDIH